MATMATIPYRFFPMLLLVLVPLLLSTGKDLGPMAAVPRATSTAVTKPRRTSRSTSSRRRGASAEQLYEEPPEGAGALDPKPGTPLRAINALLPFGTIVAVTFGGMILDGATTLLSLPEENRPPLSLISILSHSDSINALIWSSAAGWLVALSLVLSQRLLNLQEAMEAWMAGMKAAFVLLLAWALGEVSGKAKTAEFLAGSLQSTLPRWALPPLVTVLAYSISFACGSSFGTMGIMLPIAAPLAMSLGGGSREYLSHCMGAVLGGALFGNICSPISDTTILTVLATKCDLQAHVRTIGPYSLLVALLAIGLGSIPVALGLYGPLTAIAVCTAAMWAILQVACK